MVELIKQLKMNAGVRVFRQKNPAVRELTSGFTLTEVVFSVFIGALITTFFFTMMSTWRTMDKKSSVQAELLMDGRISMESIVRDVRNEMVGLAAVNFSHGNVVNALVIEADTDYDSTPDLLKGWGVRPMDEDGNGAQDWVVIEGDRGAEKTFLWELVEMTSSSLLLDNGRWQKKVMCRGLTVPWKTSDGLHRYQPFEFNGNKLELDKNSDGIVSESELGNYVTKNGVVDHIGEEDKIATIGVGIRLVKSSVGNNVESVLIYQGKIAPRNSWRPSELDEEGN